MGLDHVDTGKSYHNIGIIYHKLDKIDLALDYYFKGMNIFVKKLGKDHVDTAKSYSSIASVYSDKGNSDLAVEYL